jgi:YVTN family beta-propeller protein
MRAAAGGVASLMLAACGAATAPAPGAGGASPAGAGASPAAPLGTPTSFAPAQPGGSTAPAKAYWLYVFNVGSQDVSIVDTANNAVIATRPLGAAVRWLSNEQPYWDGSSVWTYDFPDNKLQALAIDPKGVTVVKRVDTGTTGPGHSLVISPDKQTGYLNAAGSNVINVIDLKAGSVKQKIDTGQFP